MRRSVIISASLAALLVLGNVPVARAQLLDQLKGATGLGQGGSAGGLPSVGQAGAGNTAGVLQYCVQNNYLDANSGNSVRNSLLSHVPGQSGDGSYQQGSRGLLDTGGGQTYSLGGSDSLKQKATQKLCDLVLQHGRSLL